MPVKYYALFDGDEIAGKFYSFGEPLKDDVPTNVLVLLAANGRISATEPVVASAVIPSEPAPLDGLSHSALVQTALSLISVELARSPREKLIAGIERMRSRDHDDEDEDEDGEEADDALSGSSSSAPAEPDGYAELKDKDPAKLTTAQLATVAQAEGVTFGDDVTTNAQRADAIVKAREAKAAS